MKKTGGQIERELFGLLKPAIDSFINGKLYRQGMRPIDSAFEDAVLSFMTGLSGQVEVGVLNLNVYVPNVSIGTQLVCNITRCTDIEIFLTNLIDSISSTEYELGLGSIVQTFEESSINQHFVNCKIKFKRTTL